MNDSSNFKMSNNDIQRGIANAKNLLTVLSTVDDIDASRSYIEIEYLALDGKKKVLLISRELVRTPVKIADELMKNGAALTDARQAVKAILPVGNVPHKQITARTGWHGETFVFPGKTFGPLSSRLHYASRHSINPALGLSKGTAEAWREGLREPCELSDYLILAASLAPAGVLLDMIGEEEGVVFHLHGQAHNKAASVDKIRSTSGKTTATRVAASTYGGCAKNDLITFDVTERAVEDLCFSHNNLAICIDEEGRTADSGHTNRVGISKLPYLVPSGRGAVRSNKATQDADLKNQKWSIFGLSNGEAPLDGRQKARPEGALLRMIGIPVPAGSRGGIFNRIELREKKKIAKAREMANATEQTIVANYGTAVRAFLEKIIVERERLAKRAIRLVERFVESLNPVDTPWERRFARKFAIVYAAAVLLAKLAIAPWSKDRAREAIASLYGKARRAILSQVDLTQNVLETLRKAEASGQFPRIKKGQKSKIGEPLLGASRKIKGQTVLYISLRNFKQLLHPAAHVNQTLHTLASKNILVLGADRKLTKQVAIGGTRSRYICIDRAQLLA